MMRDHPGRQPSSDLRFGDSSMLELERQSSRSSGAIDAAVTYGLTASQVRLALAVEAGHNQRCAEEDRAAHSRSNAQREVLSLEVHQLQISHAVKALERGISCYRDDDLHPKAAMSM